MNPFVLERRVFGRLTKAFEPGRPTPYERGAGRSLATQSGFLRASERQVRGAVHDADVVAIGDDLLMPEDRLLTEKVVKWCLADGRKAILLTDRTGRPVAARLKVRRKSIRRPASLTRADLKLLASIRECRGKKLKVILWTGALRLAPDRLPALFAEARLNSVFVSLSAPVARWRLGADSGWARLGNRFFFLGTSPVLSAHRRRAWHLHRDRPLAPGELKAAFRREVRSIAVRMGLKSRFPSWPVLHPFGLPFFRTLASGRWSPAVTRFLLERVERGESAVLPGAKLVFLSTLERGEVAEEAAHFVRSRSGKPVPRHPYPVVLEEAFGFLAGRWADPSRPLPSGGGVRMDQWEEVHQAGYRLGLKLARRWKNSRRARDAIRRLWKENPGTPHEALRILMALEAVR